MASIYFSPTAKNVEAGSVFTVAVKVSSQDQAMNAVSGDVSFPSGQLKVLSISKLNSIVTLWVRDPFFTNSSASAGGGDVHFEGIVLNPGFTGSDGTVIQITFQAIGSAGDQPALAFSSAAVLANDGNGTPILGSQGAAQFMITAQTTPVPQTTPSTPQASSTISTTTPTTSTVSVRPRVVTIEVPPGIDVEFILAWGLMIILALTWVGVIIATIIYAAQHRSKKKSPTSRDLRDETLRDDLNQLEEEIKAIHPKSEQDRIRRELERLEKDIKG